MVKCNKNMKLNRIKAVLEEKGISQTWLSKKMGKSFSTVNAYVCNRTQPYNEWNSHNITFCSRSSGT